LAGEELYHYFWNTFADVIIEEMKIRVTSDDEASRISAQWLLLNILATNIRMLHPFIPFITEEIWGILPREGKTLLIVEPWPKPF
ncbi:MAG: Valyl-tRNA synthetase, partial [Parcubacteria group bacterium GW2011_GWC1_44_26]